MENRPGKFPKYGNNGVKEKLGKNTQSFKKQTHEVGNYFLIVTVSSESKRIHSVSVGRDSRLPFVNRTALLS